MSQLTVETLSSIDAVDRAEWNRLSGTAYPFLRHEFLGALERQGCLGEAYGWLPRHLLLKDGDDKLLAAAPCYLKFNSYGELVFDGAWADAYRRAGLAYYPKLVVASPYTPANGPRILTADAGERPRYARALIEGAVQVAQRMEVSSLHWLFVTEEESGWMENSGLMRRTGCQFHWHNPGYRDFDDFLSTLSARKRKQIKRERRRVREAGIRFRLLRGHQAGAAEWESFHHLYRSTFDKRGGIPTLSAGFFREIGETMGDQLLLVLAYAGDRMVASAFNLVGADTLYGRHWGCFEEYHSLHFEACYYQGLDFCIREGLHCFEPGAQGEHKISRGFLPTPTWSTHWIGQLRFRGAIAHFLQLESEGMQDYIAEMHDHSPYRSDLRD
jgi:predicted N-acyltransferase